MRIVFHEELDELEAALQEEGDLVLRALRSALNALARGDDELADEVIGFDDEIDRRYLAIETGVQSLLARQTPVATDLRLVLAILRVNLHLERMADYCVTVAKLTKLMGGLDVSDDRILSSLEDMGMRAEQMIRVALDAFAEPRPREGRVAERARRPDRPREPAGGRRRALAGRLDRRAGVWFAHARDLALRREDRRPRGGHRRAGRLPRDRRAARAHRRVAPASSEGLSEAEVQDAGRRTRLANERTYLAWWRTGLTSLAVCVGLGRIVPGVTDVTKWPYQVVGAGYGVVGVVFMVDRAPPDARRSSVRSMRAGSRASTAARRAMLVVGGGASGSPPSRSCVFGD